MPDENEIVTVMLTPDHRLRLYGQITTQMEKLGYNPCDYSSLNLGFELPPEWPVDRNTQPTLAQLTVLACKLKMKIVIRELYLEVRRPCRD